jgi:hypothetical protein
LFDGGLYHDEDGFDEELGDVDFLFGDLDDEFGEVLEGAIEDESINLE